MPPTLAANHIDCPASGRGRPHTRDSAPIKLRLLGLYPLTPNIIGGLKNEDGSVAVSADGLCWVTLSASAMGCGSEHFDDVVGGLVVGWGLSGVEDDDAGTDEFG